MGNKKSNNFKVGGGASGYNTYDNWSPDGMYSLAKVSPITMPVCRVQNTVSLAELDLYEEDFTNGTLLAFANGNQVVMMTFYDQSGNGNHMNQYSGGGYPNITSGTGVPYIDVNGMAYFEIQNSSTYLAATNVNGGVALQDFSWFNLKVITSFQQHYDWGFGDQSNKGSINCTAQNIYRCNGQTITGLTASKNGYLTEECHYDQAQNTRGGAELITNGVQTVGPWTEPASAMVINDNFGFIVSTLANGTTYEFASVMFTSLRYTDSAAIMADWVLDHPLYVPS